MGDAVIVAVPTISIMVVAVMLIVRGSRREKARDAAREAPWYVGSEPGDKMTRVFFYREGNGRRVDVTNYTSVPRGPRHSEELLEALANAELEASLLNSSNGKH